MRILDAGCGSGRNLIYFLREGYEVYAVDPDVQAVESVRALAREFAPALPASNFSVEALERMSFPDGHADVVICNTVLHFARNETHFESMLRGAWRALKPGGLFFCRLGSSIGMESQIVHIEGRRYKSPDGSERYLVDEGLLGSFTERLGAELADPVKTTVVQNQRAMTTWIMRKKPLAGVAPLCTVGKIDAKGCEIRNGRASQRARPGKHAGAAPAPGPSGRLRLGVGAPGPSGRLRLGVGARRSVGLGLRAPNPPRALTARRATRREHKRGARSSRAGARANHRAHVPPPIRCDMCVRQ
ncbi:MAG: class I SAM-dependent methyltransferase [Terriglobales bacterium]